MPKPPDYPGAPQWVKRSAFLAGALLLVIGLLLVAGGGRHGRWRHVGNHPTSGLNARS